MSEDRGQKSEGRMRKKEKVRGSEGEKVGERVRAERLGLRTEVRSRKWEFGMGKKG